MAKKDKAIYSPGELSRVRDKLGRFDADEAKKLAQKLGGDVGYERTEQQEQERLNPPRTRREKVQVKIGKGARRLELAPEIESEFLGNETKKPSRQAGMSPDDDPSVPLRINYWERIKMDRLAGQPEFEIKSPAQVFYSMISFFSDANDYVSSVFVTRRMAEYYKKIEVLVVSTRSLFPRNNIRRNERIKKTAPLACSILDVIRYWDIEKISGDLARIQARPKSARAKDFGEILRLIYKPIFILGKLDVEAHIRSAYKILYKVLYIENPMEAQDKYQELIRSALTAFTGIQKDISYLLYPLLLKLISPTCLSYGNLFAERKYRFMSFLNVTEDAQIDPGVAAMLGDDKEIKPGEEGKEEASKEQEQKPGNEAEQEKEKEISEEEKERRAIEESEKKALARGLHVMEMLFPKAGWDRASTFPDFYPYYLDIFDLKRGIVNIAPTDPMQQVFILMRCLEELFFGLRYASFSTVQGSSGNMERIDTILGETINEWHYYIGLSFEKEYLPRMAEYVRILEGSIEERNSQYTKKLITEMHWIKRFYLLPFYKFESLSPPSLQKKDTIPIYAKIKSLRKYLASVAYGIEQGNKAGGAEANAPCAGIENPWTPYVFQVPNPLSTRLDAILAPKARNNASLVYFCLAIASVLDCLVNDENSWAYGPRPGTLFRSQDGEGVTPLTGVSERIDADSLFKQALKQRQKKAETE